MDVLIFAALLIAEIIWVPISDCKPIISTEYPEGLDVGDSVAIERALNNGNIPPHILGAKCKI